jgi:hypothetical protein
MLNCHVEEKLRTGREHVGECIPKLPQAMLNYAPMCSDRSIGRDPEQLVQVAPVSLERVRETSPVLGVIQCAAYSVYGSIEFETRRKFTQLGAKRFESSTQPTLFFSFLFRYAYTNSLHSKHIPS